MNKHWSEKAFYAALAERMRGYKHSERSFKNLILDACADAFGTEPQRNVFGKLLSDSEYPRLSGKATNVLNDLFIEFNCRTIGDCEYPKPHRCLGGRHDLDEILNDSDPRSVVDALGSRFPEGAESWGSGAARMKAPKKGDRLAHWWFPLVGTVVRVLPEPYFGLWAVTIKFDGIKKPRTMLDLELAPAKNAAKIRGHRS